MTNIVFRTGAGSNPGELEIDPDVKCFRRKLDEFDSGFDEWTDYEWTDRPIGLGEVTFFGLVGSWYGSEATFAIVDFVCLRDEETSTDLVKFVPPSEEPEFDTEAWSRTWNDWGLSTFPKESLFYDPFFDHGPASGLIHVPALVPDIRGLDLIPNPQIEDRWRELLDAIQAAPNPSLADFKIAEAAEEMSEILERRSAGPAHTADYFEELFNDFFDQFDPQDHLAKWAITPDEPDLVVAIDEVGTVKICVVLTTIELGDLDTSV